MKLINSIKFLNESKDYMHYMSDFQRFFKNKGFNVKENFSQSDDSSGFGEGEFEIEKLGKKVTVYYLFEVSGTEIWNVDCVITISKEENFIEKKLDLLFLNKVRISNVLQIQHYYIQYKISQLIYSKLKWNGKEFKF